MPIRTGASHTHINGLTASQRRATRHSFAAAQAPPRPSLQVSSSSSSSFAPPPTVSSSLYINEDLFALMTSPVLQISDVSMMTPSAISRLFRQVRRTWTTAIDEYVTLFDDVVVDLHDLQDLRRAGQLQETLQESLINFQPAKKPDAAEVQKVLSKFPPEKVQDLASDAACAICMCDLGSSR